MDTTYICNIYAALIRKGLKTIDSVPIDLQATVLAILNK